jgi:O-antigen ligase
MTAYNQPSVAQILQRKKRWYAAALALLVTLTVLFATYSRSAWIGTTLSLAALLALMLRMRLRTILLAVVVGAALIAGLVFAFRGNDRVQNTFFHTDETSRATHSSNDDRARVMTQGFRQVLHEPFGRGPGTAGPASQYNYGKSPRIAENYFIQIAQETGWIGLALYIALLGLVAKRLWEVRTSGVLPLVLLASLLGLSVVNLLSHAWADDTLAYIWWGYAGLVLGLESNQAIHKT